ncbi:uncharacterized protein B0H18DRAFT_162143 [Fomitopsis serialis]|uniref:uncharacterized protein n=1 Tax=Fomitopsis serialis TaxID=139415 RepID=UPI0020080761|nr:uncharacterized protein B0H18DRAFT_162143 [Neoantrodia serialis]KAH9930117.1 hypothetical protein B0H18DRAFT_162143 [Neoantrodia serialis]
MLFFLKPEVNPTRPAISDQVMPARSETVIVPTHNGRGSIGPDGKEPAWHLLRLDPVVVPLHIPLPGRVSPVFEGLQGISFNLKGATQPGIPWDSKWRDWVFDAMEDPTGIALPRPRPGMKPEKTIVIHLNWPGYACERSYKIATYRPNQDGIDMPLTRFELLSDLFTCLEVYCKVCSSEDCTVVSTRWYNQHGVSGTRAWRLALPGYDAQEAGHVTVDCLWVFELMYSSENVFIPRLALAVQTAPPHQGQPLYSQRYVQCNDSQ